MATEPVVSGTGPQRTSLSPTDTLCKSCYDMHSYSPGYGDIFSLLLSVSSICQENNYKTKQRGRACYYDFRSVSCQVSVSKSSAEDGVGYATVSITSRRQCSPRSHCGRTVVDEQTGFAAQCERVMAAVLDQHGNVIVMVQERIRAVRVVRQLMYIIE